MAMKRFFAMIMALCICLSAMPLQTLAAEETTTETGTETSPEGLETNITTTTTTTTDDNGNTTVTVVIEKATEGTTEDGVSVERNESSSTTTTTNEDGLVTGESWEEEGTETKEWTEKDTGDTAGQPEVEVTLTPGETTTGTAEESTTVTDETGTTTTTTTDRTVTAETSDAEVTVNETDTGLVADEEVVLNGPAPVYDEEDGPATDAAGKEGLFDRNYLSSQTMDRIQIGDAIIWVNDSNKTITNIYIPEGAELPEDFSYEVGQSVAGWFNGSNLSSKNVPAGSKIDNNVKINNLDNWYKDGEMIVDIPEGADFMYVGTGEHSKYYATYINVVYKKDDAGNPVLDEDGNPVIEKLVTNSGNVAMVNDEATTDLDIAALFSTYNGSRAVNFMLMDENGNRVYAYCCDLETGTAEGTWYSVSNLEDSEYYASEESEEHIRTIALNGYWGTSDVPKEDGTYEMGSLESIKAKLKAAIEAGEISREYETYLYSECECGGTCSSKNPCTGGKLQYDENGDPIVVKYDMLELLDELTEGEALLATQTAIWSFANGHQNALNGVDGRVILDTGYRGNFKGTNNEHEPLDNEGNARAEFLCSWLMNLESDAETTVIINDKNFVEDMSLTVGDKVADHEANQDGNKDNDVYNASLNFTLAFVPGENDDLLVQIKYTDLDGKEVTVVKRLAGTNSEGQSYEDIKPEADGSYVLRGLKLSENEDFNFDLRLEGTQYLENGVYVYSPVGGRDVSQTFVGVAEGEKNVDVSIGVTIKFDVDENNHVVAERKWHNEGDPSTEHVTPEEPEHVTAEAPRSRQIFRLTNQTGVEEIPDEEVPLASAPKTGDMTSLIVIITMMAAVCLVIMTISDKKRRA